MVNREGEPLKMEPAAILRFQANQLDAPDHAVGGVHRTMCGAGQLLDDRHGDLLGLWRRLGGGGGHQV